MRTVGDITLRTPHMNYDLTVVL